MCENIERAIDGEIYREIKSKAEKDRERQRKSEIEADIYVSTTFELICLIVFLVIFD